MSRTIIIELDAFHAAELEALAVRMKATPGEVVSLALDQLCQEPAPYSPEQIAAIEEGLAQAEQGETIAQGALFARLDKKYGL